MFISKPAWINMHRYARVFVGLGSALFSLGLSLILARYLSHLGVQALPIDGTNPVHLTLLPNQPTLLPGETTDITVYLHPNNRTVTATELHLNLDPNLLEFAGPIATHSALPWILPNCQAGPADPQTGCPATSSATLSETLIYLAVSCSEAGCILPASSSAYPIATFPVRSVAESASTSLVTAITATGSGTLIAALGSDSDVLGVASATSLSLVTCTLPLDIVPNSQIDVTDIMQVASIWNSIPGTLSYNGQMDLDHDHQITVSDIQQVASLWRQSCVN